jgi:glutamyl-tRNA synthetase
MNSASPVRVRFAPSPTGYLHVGGLRTALYNYLFARKTNGVFVLRIEDTDRTRYVEGAVENLIDTLAWCGLDYDEGPGKGGALGPYVQSERLTIYKEQAASLVAAGKAYYCFCTAERLEQLRNEQQGRKLQTKYDKKCLHMAPGEVKSLLDAGTPHVLRMNVESGHTITVNDLIRGSVDFDSSLIDDQVLIKSDGFPTYHYANVVDDHLMQISHVIRGEEWLPSTPKHVLLYQSFGWECPKFAHLPLLLNPDKSKLSKRQGDVAVEDYRNKGYLKDTLVNFVALLGWNPGTEREFFYLPDLIEAFSLESVNKSGAVFNIEKLNWLNFEHLRVKSDSELLGMLRLLLSTSEYSGREYADAYLLKVITSMRPRISFIRDLLTDGGYFFAPPAVYDPEIVKKRWGKETPDELRVLVTNLGDVSSPGMGEYESALQKSAKSLNIPNAKLIHPLRLALSGVGGGPGIYDILDILGKEESIRRINAAIERIR